MAIREGLGEQVVGVDTSRAMLEQFDRKAEGKGVRTVAVEVSEPYRKIRKPGARASLLPPHFL